MRSKSGLDAIPLTLESANKRPVQTAIREEGTMAIPESALEAVSTAATSETRIGELRFPDGVPDPATTESVYDNLDSMRGVEAFLNAFQGVSMLAIRRGFRDAGVADGSVLLFSGLMDSHSLFLTGNADTVYFLAFVDLSDGPVVIDVPPESLGLINDMWFRWVIDVGLPGPDRGMGARFLLVGPDYDGPLPEGGFEIAHSATNGACLLGRAFMQDSDPKPTVERIKQGLKIYPYVPGTLGTSIGSFLSGDAPMAALKEPEPPEFIEGTGLEMNTLPPNDFSFFELLDELVQAEPASALEPEIAGHARSIGIVKGQDFKPDARMRKILEEAVAIANATARTISSRARADEGFAYYDDDPKSHWFNPLFAGGYKLDGSTGGDHEGGRQAVPDHRARARSTRASASSTSRPVTLRRCACASRAWARNTSMTFFDAKERRLDGEEPLPDDPAAGHSGGALLVDHGLRQPDPFDAADRSGLSPRRQPELPVACGHCRRRTDRRRCTSRPSNPTVSIRGNWIQTDAGARAGCPSCAATARKPSFFDKSWRPGDGNRGPGTRTGDGLRWRRFSPTPWRRP